MTQNKPTKEEAFEDCFECIYTKGKCPHDKRFKCHYCNGTGKIKKR